MFAHKSSTVAFPASDETRASGGGVVVVAGMELTLLGAGRQEVVGGPVKSEAAPPPSEDAVRTLLPPPPDTARRPPGHCARRSMASRKRPRELPPVCICDPPGKKGWDEERCGVNLFFCASSRGQRMPRVNRFPPFSLVGVPLSC